MDSIVNALKRSVLLCASILSTIHERMKATMDISVQFFGVDWDHLESVTENMIQVIAEMSRILRQGSAVAESSQIELLLPRYQKQFEID